ncbi:MAG TPA: hypothetical protein VGE41_00690, partial [Verrucomicrobiae bacterium]
MAENMGLRLKKIYTAVYNFLTEQDIARQDDSQVSRFMRFAHFWLLAIKTFYRNRCPLRATALAYTTLLALVPLLAIGASITKSLLVGRGDAATHQLIEQLVDTAAPQLKLIPSPKETKPVEPSAEATEQVKPNDAAPLQDTKPSVGPAKQAKPIDARQEVISRIEAFIKNMDYRALGFTGLA